MQTPLPLWGELVSIHLPPYLLNTILLTFGGGFLCLLWGSSCAWLVTNYSFPASRLLSWALLLPLACPVYISGFIYSDLLGGLLPWIHSITAANILFGVGLYPYVYVFSRAAFLNQSLDYQWAAQSMGLGPIQVLMRVSLPMALPSISFGLLLAIIEIINDFGLVNHYAINTLTLGIYRVWLGMGNYSGALVLSVFVLGILAFIMFAEAYIVSKRKRFENQSGHKKIPLRKLEAAYAIAAIIWCLVPFALGFAIPLFFLFYYAAGALDSVPLLADSLLSLLGNTFLVIALAIGLCIGFALIINFSGRNLNSRLGFIFQSINFCYALPGTLLGLACIAFWGVVNNAAGDYFSIGGLFILLFAYVVRFTPPANRSIFNNLEKVTPNMELAAKSFALNRFEIFKNIYLPLLKASILSSSVIIFAEILKELPLVLILRPFNFETLATFTYQYASDEQLNIAAFPAILLIIAGLPVLYFLNRLASYSRKELNV